jgi:hypothetical protein
VRRFAIVILKYSSRSIFKSTLDRSEGGQTLSCVFLLEELVFWFDRLGSTSVSASGLTGFGAIRLSVNYKGSSKSSRQCCTIRPQRNAHIETPGCERVDSN